MRTLEARASEGDHAAPLESAQAAAPASPVTDEDLLHPERKPGQWLMYSGNYQSHRFSPLNQITRANVAGMQLKWIFQRGLKEKIETTPLVVDGVMYSPFRRTMPMR